MRLKSKEEVQLGMAQLTEQGSSDKPEQLKQIKQPPLQSKEDQVGKVWEGFVVLSQLDLFPEEGKQVISDDDADGDLSEADLIVRASLYELPGGGFDVRVAGEEDRERRSSLVEVSDVCRRMIREMLISEHTSARSGAKAEPRD
jgi:hypothetical protein